MLLLLLLVLVVVAVVTEPVPTVVGCLALRADRRRGWPAPAVV